MARIAFYPRTVVYVRKIGIATAPTFTSATPTLRSAPAAAVVFVVGMNPVATIVLERL